ncbi:urease accessory protein UreF [Tropicimonas sp. S265A]|uniref:urease accessory protein UreF n=1 Tax=Tropicimonas sp. S265A TaxID=3415134 RepID=UPI003C7D5416
MDEARLTLQQWLSPSFPVSAFAYSHGLEWAISEGRIADAETLRGWLETVLRTGSGRTDGALVAAAARGEDPGALSELAEALATSAERWAETRDQGAAFVATTNALYADTLQAMPYPVAFGVRARALELPVAEVVAMYLQAFTSNLVSAAVRFIPLGQTDGQRVASALHPVIAALGVELSTLPTDRIGTSAVLSDMAAMAHETMDVRIFRS